jgi:type II secretory ATPase GspE/PulE/Tfp pilus assembly ATPase PilB-like protein
LTPQGLDDLVEEYRSGSVLDPEEARRRLTDAAVRTGDPPGFSVWEPVGCPQCGGKGYKGRLGIYEVLENDAILRALIQQRARPTEVFEAATRSGMHSLRHDALEKVLQGRVDRLQARTAYA